MHWIQKHANLMKGLTNLNWIIIPNNNIFHQYVIKTKEWL